MTTKAPPIASTRRRWSSIASRRLPRVLRRLQKCPSWWSSGRRRHLCQRSPRRHHQPATPTSPTNWAPRNCPPIRRPRPRLSSERGRADGGLRMTKSSYPFLTWPFIRTLRFSILTHPHSLVREYLFHIHLYILSKNTITTHVHCFVLCSFS